ncbi:MAG: carboxynorspermidine decarboxylase [Saccharofermentanales bacterium]
MAREQERLLDHLVRDWPSLTGLPSPCYLIDQDKLEANGRILDRVRKESGCKILLAQKAFSNFAFYPLLSAYLDGAASSGLFEARLARQHLPADSQVHVYAPAYKEEDLEALLDLADVLVFNSFDQWERYKDKVLGHPRPAGRPLSLGLRINPGYSEVEVALYDPASPGSRLGEPASSFLEGLSAGRFQGLQGIHFHSLCEQGAPVLERTLAAIRQSFGEWPGGLSWINLGGGHHITKGDYDVDLLVRLIRQVQEESGAAVYLEPGEAVALDAGLLLAEVLDLFRPAEGTAAILDTSAACHAPDVLEMPYRPAAYLLKAPGGPGGKAAFYPGREEGQEAFNVNLAGPSCLAGDTFGTYSFPVMPQPGDRVAFCDMAIYTMVKNNTFNGMPLPAIARFDSGSGLEILRRFSYEDFKSRLG